MAHRDRSGTTFAAARIACVMALESNDLSMLLSGIMMDSGASLH